jgi:hypothetical protein
MSNSKYYLSVSVVCIAITIYNFNMSSTGKLMTCYQNVSMDNTTYSEYEKSLGSSATIQSNYSDGYYQVLQQGTNIYPSLNTITGIIYLTIMIICLFLSVIISYMSNLLPEDFISISKFKKILICLTKIFPVLIILLHWVILFIILAFWFMIFSNECNYSTSTTLYGISSGMYFQNILVLNLVNSCLWILLHYGGAVLREILYEEPFMYMPYVGSKNKYAVIILKKLGP